MQFKRGGGDDEPRRTSGGMMMAFTMSLSRCLRTAYRGIHSTAYRREQFLNANQETFAKATLNENGKVVIVDFYADWCQPCKTLSPVLDKLSMDSSVKTGSGKPIDLVTVDTDSEYELAAKYKIRSLPTVVAFKDGEPVDQFIGALNEAGVRKFLSRV